MPSYTKAVENIALADGPGNRYSDARWLLFASRILAFRMALSVTVLIDKSTRSSNLAEAPGNFHEWLIQYRRRLTVTTYHHNFNCNLTSNFCDIVLSSKIMARILRDLLDVPASVEAFSLRNSNFNTAFDC